MSDWQLRAKVHSFRNSFSSSCCCRSLGDSVRRHDANTNDAMDEHSSLVRGRFPFDGRRQVHQDESVRHVPSIIKKTLFLFFLQFGSF